MVESTALVNNLLVAVTALDSTMAWRSNPGQALLPSGQRVWINVRGIGDITGVRRGRAFCIEAKFGTGKLNRNQKQFREAWTAAGGIFIVARSVEQGIADILAATS